MSAAAWLEGLPAHRWNERLLRDGPRIANWVLGIGLGVQAALIVTDIAAVGRHAKPPAAPVGHLPAARQRAFDIAALSNAHLFGAPPRQDVANAPQTNIPLVLTGTIAGDDPQNGLAILGQTAQSAKVYAVGDNVPGGARLHSVYGDHVVIDRGGQLESLALPRKPSASGPPPSAAVLRENPSIEHMRRMITEQPSLLTDVLRPQPVFEHGHMNGFRVYPGRNRQAFTRLGLRPGDQVTAINGTPLDDRERGEQIMHTLSSSSEAHLTIMRGGVQQELSLNIAQVAQDAESLAAQAPQTPMTPQSPTQTSFAPPPAGMAPPAGFPAPAAEAPPGGVAPETPGQ